MRTGQRRERLPNWAVGLILVVLLVIASLYAFTKSVPWSDPYTVQAVFPIGGEHPARPRPSGSPGVNVGKVTKIEHLAARRRRPGHGAGRNDATIRRPRTRLRRRPS